jgi:aryl-alcohol dehydrogenase-like predicted oxidoreductase
MNNPHDISAPPRRRALRLLAALPALAAMTDAQSGAPAALVKRTVPRSGEALPAVGLGTWQTFDVGPNAPERRELAGVLRALVDGGASVIDSSPMYGESERVVGDLAADLSIHPRLFIATKVWTTGREAGIRQMENSLRLMRAQRIDLMQVHNLQDLATHVKTLREWKAAGRIRYLGITHYHAGAHRELERLVKTREYDFVQFNYSMAEREAEDRLLPACAESGTAVLVNRPFSQAGLFSRVRGKPLPPWSAEFDCASWAQFFLKFILGHPAVTCVIPGTRLVKHMQDNLAAGRGRLPDAATRRRMVEYLDSL